MGPHVPRPLQRRTAGRFHRHRHRAISREPLGVCGSSWHHWIALCELYPAVLMHGTQRNLGGRYCDLGAISGGILGRTDAFQHPPMPKRAPVDCTEHAHNTHHKDPHTIRTHTPIRFGVLYCTHFHGFLWDVLSLPSSLFIRFAT